jgi:hypothetical protein
MKEDGMGGASSTLMDNKYIQNISKEILRKWNAYKTQT